MLTPDQINVLRDKVSQLTDPVLEFLLEDIARRVSEAGQLTSSASYQIWRAQQLGMSQREVKKEIKKRLRVSNRELRKLLTQSAEVGYDFDIRRFPYVQKLPFNENEALQRIVQGTIDMVGGEFNNLTQTLGMVAPNGETVAVDDIYRKCCDEAFRLVNTGAADYNAAIRRATKNLADKGLRTIDYESGVSRSIESAVRGSVMGGMGLMQEQISKQTHDEFGCDGWEISAHAASAPDHEPIQGKQYSDAEYTLLNNSLVRRIGTLNCGHSAFPIIIGVNAPQYTDEELEKLRKDNADGVVIDGRHYTKYEATQMQRKIERAIRKQKNRILVDESAGDKDKLLTDQIRLQRYRQEYVRFSKAAGLRTQNERAQVAGFGVQQAAEATRKGNRQIAIIENFRLNMAKSGYITKGFDYYTGDEETLTQMHNAFSRVAKDFPDESNGMTIMLSKCSDSGTIGWVEFGSEKIIHYNMAQLKDWKSFEIECNELEKTGYFPKGTSASGCFYHEFGHSVWLQRNGKSLKKHVDKVLFDMGYGYVNTTQRSNLLIKLLSKYSDTDTKPSYQEVIAECFSEWYNSDTPREFCTRFLKEVGIL